MNIEFHYYITYLVAARAGLGADDAATLAHACQYVDDNDMKFEIDKGEASAYRNYISQTMNILKPRKTLMRIYPLFHFVPGDPQSEMVQRKDGTMHWLNTTPGSKNAERILDEALATGNLYRIGVACHAYADSWAHQNFVGYYEDFNAIKGVLEAATPDVGHADARHDPDWPALVWRDKRLLSHREAVDNKTRFLEAAGCTFRKLRRFADPACSEKALDDDAAELNRDLDEAIGGRDQRNQHEQERIKRYVKVSRRQAYGQKRIPVYSGDLWFDEAINEEVRWLRDRSESPLRRVDLWPDVLTWRDREGDGYKQTHWYRFQEAVREHQHAAWGVLEGKNFRWTELEGF